MFWKLILAFNIIATFIIIPYMMSDISDHLDTCETLIENIRRY